MERATRHMIKVDPDAKRHLKLIAAHTGETQYAVLARLLAQEWSRLTASSQKGS